MTTLATGDLQQPTTTNALSVLFSALPTSLIAPIQSEYSDLFDPVESGISSLTDDIFGSPTRTRSGIRTRTRPTASPSSITTSSTTTSPSTTAPTDPPTTTDTNARPTYATSVDSDAADATSTEAPEAEERPERSEHAATIGIATGAASGGVLAILAGVFLWRRRQQGKSPFAGRGGNGGKGVYPEVAWLYDPNITPPRSRAGSGSGQQLIPEPRPGSVEIGGTPIMGGHSPEMRGVSSPLLAPVVAASRDMTGGGRRSRSGSDVNMLRPLTAIGEEATPRGSMS